LVRDLDKDAKSGCLWQLRTTDGPKTSLATIARKPLKRQAAVGRLHCCGHWSRGDLRQQRSVDRKHSAGLGDPS